MSASEVEVPSGAATAASAESPSDDTVASGPRAQAGPVDGPRRAEVVARRLAIIAPFATAAVLAFAEGGFFITSWAVASIVLWGVVAASLLGLRWSPGGPLVWVAAAGLPLLALWQGLSSAWADEPTAAIAAMNLTLLYAAAFLVPALALDSSAALRLATWVALGAAAAVGVAALGARLLPGLVGGDDYGRLSFPVGYWNALGALMAFGAALGVGLAASPAVRPWLRGLALAAVPGLGLALYLTLSRGAIAVLVLCLIGLVALGPDRLDTAVAALVGGAGAVGLSVVAASYGNLTSLGQDLEPHVHSGKVVAWLTLGVTVAAGAAGLGLALVGRRAGPRSRRAASAILGGLVLVAVVAAVATHPPDGGPFTWSKNQFESFKSVDSGERSNQSAASQIAVSAGTGRWQNWSVAAEEFRSAPLAGTGAGDYRFWWNQERPIDLHVVNAHSLYLEVLGESGLVGLALLALPLAAGAGLILWARFSVPDVARRRELAVALTACAVVALHAAGDWDWQLPAVVLPAVALGGAAVMAASRMVERPRRAPAAASWVLAAAAVIPALLLLGPLAATTKVEAGRAAAADGRLAVALDDARDAAGIAPADPAPRLLEAYVLDDLGRPAAADAAYARAIARSPRDWSAMSDWAGSLLARGDVAAARILIRRATALNPREERIAVLSEMAAAR